MALTRNDVLQKLIFDMKDLGRHLEVWGPDSGQEDSERNAARRLLMDAEALQWQKLHALLECPPGVFPHL
jgi:hypothetical protein